MPLGRDRVSAVGTWGGRWESGEALEDPDIWRFISEVSEYMEDGGGRETGERAG